MASRSFNLTRNLKDFPTAVLTQYRIQAVAPDPFIHALLRTHPEDVVATAQQHRANLKNPLKSVEEYLAALDQQGLHKTVSAMQEYKDRI